MQEEVIIMEEQLRNLIIDDINEEKETEATVRRKQLEKMAKDKPEEFAKLLRSWIAERINRRLTGYVKEREKNLAGKQKAALLLISLGPEVSASVYKHLNEEEIERLTLEISGVKKVEPEIKEDIIEEFHNMH